MSSILPLELLELVVSNLNPKDDGAELARLAQTCRTTHHLAIPLLYSHLHLYSDKQLRRLLENLSLQTGNDDKALPYPTLTDIPLQVGVNERCTGQGTRKLSYFLLVEYITLHFLPTDAAFTETMQEYLDYTVCQVPVSVQYQNQLRRLHGSHLFPRIAGVAFGKGLILELCDKLTQGHPQPCVDTEHKDQIPTDDHHVLQSCGIDPHGPELSGLRLLPYLFGLSWETCWNINDIPVGMCPLLQRATMCAVTSDRRWDPLSRSVSHSSFPRSSLAPCTQVNGRWRHYVDVEIESEDYGPENASSKDAHAGKAEETLTALAEDLYSIALDTLEDIADYTELHGEKPRRRDIVISGLSEAQVRELEERFAGVVEARFYNPEAVVVDHSIGIYDHRWSNRSGEVFIDDDRNDSRVGRAWDIQDPFAVRQFQKRVLMFDFLHTEKAARCATCGVGEGKKEQYGGGEDRFWVFPE